MICRHWAAGRWGGWDSKAKLCWRASGALGRRVSPRKRAWDGVRGSQGIPVGRAGLHPVRAGRPGREIARGRVYQVNLRCVLRAVCDADGVLGLPAAWRR